MTYWDEDETCSLDAFSPGARYIQMPARWSLEMGFPGQVRDTPT